MGYDKVVFVILASSSRVALIQNCVSWRSPVSRLSTDACSTYLTGLFARTIV